MRHPSDPQLRPWRGKLRLPAVPRGRAWRVLRVAGFVVLVYGLALLITALLLCWGYWALLSWAVPAEADYWASQFTLGDALRLPITWILAAVLAVGQWVANELHKPTRDAGDPAAAGGTSPPGCCHDHRDGDGR